MDALRWLGAVVILLASTGAAWADAASAVAALNDPKAEARYLAQLCATVQREWGAYTDAVAAAQAAQRSDDSAALQRNFAESTVHQKLFYAASDDLKAAREVVRARRGTLPKGAAECPLKKVDLP